MGIAPLQFVDGQNAETLNLNGTETYSISIPSDYKAGQRIKVEVKFPSCDKTTNRIYQKTQTNEPFAHVCIVSIFAEFLLIEQVHCQVTNRRFEIETHLRSKLE